MASEKSKNALTPFKNNLASPFFILTRLNNFAVTPSFLVIYSSSSIDLVTVFDAILTSRQTSDKLQCLYENLMSNNFRKTAVLKKI